MIYDSWLYIFFLQFFTSHSGTAAHGFVSWRTLLLSHQYMLRSSFPTLLRGVHARGFMRPQQLISIFSKRNNINTHEYSAIVFGTNGSSTILPHCSCLCEPAAAAKHVFISSSFTEMCTLQRIMTNGLLFFLLIEFYFLLSVYAKGIE